MPEEASTSDSTISEAARLEAGAAEPLPAAVGKPGSGTQSPFERLNAAYRRMALQYHPDWNQSPGLLNQEQQSQAIQQLVRARDLLQLAFVRHLIIDNIATDNDLSRRVATSRPPLDDECMFCGYEPVAQVDLTYQEACVIDSYRFELTGPSCQRCGTEILRRFRRRTITAGWWSPQTAFNNLLVLRTIRSNRRILCGLKPPTRRSPAIVALLEGPIEPPS